MGLGKTTFGIPGTIFVVCVLARGILGCMNKIVEELDRRLKQLDRTTAAHVEQLVRDALALAGDSAKPSAANQWPDDYFDRTAGALATEEFERSQQDSPPTREAW